MKVHLLFIPYLLNILVQPLTGNNGPGMVIHWNKNEKTVHSYYANSDQLERQDSNYTNRTSLFLDDINKGNASLKLMGLNLNDEGVYTCYAATDPETTKIEVELKLGSFHHTCNRIPRAERRRLFNMLFVWAYPHPNIKWTENNTTNPESPIEEISPHPPFSVKSQLNITGSNSSYQCMIENSLLNQRWIGEWKTEGTFVTAQDEKVIFPCKLKNEDVLAKKNITVSWSRVENMTCKILASSLSSRVSDNRFTWTKDTMHRRDDFSLTLESPTPSDSGKYLCNISSVDYTQLTLQLLTVEPHQGKSITWVYIVIPSVIIILIIFGLICHKRSCNSNSNSDQKQEQPQELDKLNEEATSETTRP